MKQLTLVLFLSTLTLAQFPSRVSELPSDTLATVGATVITAKDYLERFELMPWPNKDKAGQIEFAKLEFLYSLVAEKLLALEAAAQNIGFDSTTKKLQRNLERMFVRDELYKREVHPKIVIPPEETKEGMRRFPYEIHAAVFGILSKSEGMTLRNKVIQSKNKKTVLKRFYDSLYIPVDTILVSYGFPDKNIEDAVFSIGKDSISYPVETSAYGWVMFYLIGKGTNAQNISFSHPDRLHKVNSIIHRRIEDSVAVRAFAAVTAPQRAEVRPDLFFPLADSVYEILRSDSAAFESKGLYQFPAYAVSLLEEKFSSELNKDFVVIESGNMTVGEVLTGLNNNYLVFPKPLNPDAVRIVLNNNIKTVVQNELLSREGLKRNLQETENVRHDISVWMDSRKSRLLLKNIIDTLQQNVDSVKQAAKNEYIQEAIDVYIGSLAKKYNVQVYETTLRNINTTTTSMVTWRHLGFGGRILAVPQVIRQFEWKYEWQRQQLLNQ